VKCATLYYRNSEQISGLENIAETDKSKFGKTEYNCGKCVDGCWVFGGIEHDSKLLKCLFVTVSDHSAQTLIPLIKHWIITVTTIVSDCWKSYSMLASKVTFMTQLTTVSICNNRIVAMATGRGLRGWTDGRARQAQMTSGKLWARTEGSCGEGGMAYDDGQTGARVQARLGRQTGRQMS